MDPSEAVGKLVAYVNTAPAWDDLSEAIRVALRELKLVRPLALKVDEALPRMLTKLDEAGIPA